MLYRQQLLATRPWHLGLKRIVGLQGITDEIVTARLRPGQGLHTEPAASTHLGRGQAAEVQPDNRFPRKILGFRFPKHTGNAIAKPGQLSAMPGWCSMNKEGGQRVTEAQKCSLEPFIAIIYCTAARCFGSPCHSWKKPSILYRPCASPR